MGVMSGKKKLRLEWLHYCSAIAFTSVHTSILSYFFDHEGGSCIKLLVLLCSILFDIGKYFEVGNVVLVLFAFKTTFPESVLN